MADSHCLGLLVCSLVGFCFVLCGVGGGRGIRVRWLVVCSVSWSSDLVVRAGRAVPDRWLVGGLAGSLAWAVVRVGLGRQWHASVCPDLRLDGWLVGHFVLCLVWSGRGDGRLVLFPDGWFVGCSVSWPVLCLVWAAGGWYTGAVV